MYFISGKYRKSTLEVYLKYTKIVQGDALPSKAIFCNSLIFVEPGSFFYLVCCIQ